MYQLKKIAVVIPALNEEASIATVVRELKLLLDKNGNALIDDLVVCDNGSSDRTALYASEAGARIVHESIKGYGAACLAGIRALNSPDIVVFVDADHSVLAADVQKLLTPMSAGADLVIGSRVLGRRESGALTVPQRFGNWLAARTIRFIWNAKVTDLGPLRAICHDALLALQMESLQFGWTVEMQVKAIQAGLAVEEVPVASLKRIGQSKISGTVRGVIGAALGIFGTIFMLRWREKRLMQSDLWQQRS